MVDCVVDKRRVEGSEIVPRSYLEWLCSQIFHRYIHKSQKYFTKKFAYICVFHIYFVPLQQIFNRYERERTNRASH